MNPKSLPDALARLPRMAFTRTPAPDAAAQRRADIAFDIRSSDTLAQAYERREAAIRGRE